MANKTIPQLPSETQIDNSTLVPIDTGIQTFKISVPNFAKGLRKFLGDTPAAKTSSYVIGVNDGLIFIDSTSGAFDLTLPNPALFINKSIKIKDIAGKLAENRVTLKRHSAETIDAVAVDYFLRSPYGSWEVFTDGVNWFFI